MRFPSLAGITDAFLSASRRFPVPMLIAIAGTICWMTYIEIESNYDRNSLKWLLKCWMVSHLGLALTIALTSFSETRFWSDWRKWALLGGGIAVLGLYYLTINLDYFEVVGIWRYFGLLAIVHLLVAFSPYLNRLSVSDFWSFNARILGNFLAGAFYTMILWAGLSGAVLGVNELFELNIKSKIYMQLFSLLAGIFNTAWFLYHFPKTYEFSKEGGTVFETLCKFILIPISVLYLLILYAYTGKILLQWSLPVGWVSSLVIGFAAFGIFTWLLNYMLSRQLKTWPFYPYKRWFLAILLPMILLLFVAIGRRISDYGVTKERYIVAHVGLWLLSCAVYFILSQKDNIKFVPISLAGFILVALYGPLNMFRVGERSQTHVLEVLLEKNGLWENGLAKPAASMEATEDYARMQDVLQYLTSRKGLGTEKPQWLSNMPDSLWEPDSWNNASNIIQWLKVEDKAISGINEAYTVSGSGNNDLTIPDGYTSLFDIELYGRGRRVDQKGKYFELDTNGISLFLRQLEPDGTRTVLDTYYLGSLSKEWTSGKNYLELRPSTTCKVSGRKTDALLLVESATLSIEHKMPRLNYLRGKILLKLK
jgi:hypothetical protein